MKFTIFLASFVIFCSSTCDADELFGSSFSRGAHGEVSEYSAEQLRRMILAAKADGRIAVWITFDVSFDQSPTVEQIQQTQAEVEIAYEQAVFPLIRRGHATLIELPATLDGAPGRMISVNAPGLRWLARQESVKYIGYILLDE